MITTYEHHELAGYLAASSCIRRSHPSQVHNPSQHRPVDAWHYAVYAARAVDGEVLYVGRSGQLEIRLREHARAARWWGDVASLHVWLLPCAGQGKAFETERIKALRPRHNVVGKLWRGRPVAEAVAL